MMGALRPVLRPLRSTADTLLAGWFGPIGVAALFYAALAERETGLAEAWTVGSLVVAASVAASVVAFGVTATPLTRWYGRLAGREAKPARGGGDRS